MIRDELYKNMSNKMSLPGLLRRVDRLHKLALRNRLVSEVKAEPGQPVILMILEKAASSDYSVSQNDLAQALHVSDPTITTSMKSLIRQGYVSREQDPADRRRMLPKLTPQGEEAAKKCRRCFNKVNAEMLDGFSKEEEEQLLSMVRRIVANLEKSIDR
ncbi:MAG: MarR family transcriptional regulator [Oscillospiraceae bacterium]|nr:MarR family transcriptional regulator [Oscillospiraceae bacterium]